MFLENLESRRHFTVTASMAAGGQLNVVGDHYGNSIWVGYSSDWRSVVVMEEAGVGNFVQRFSAAAGAVRGISIWGMDGPDLITVDSWLTLPTGIYGGNGDDHLSGGGGMDAMEGNAGHDTILGNAGPDYMWGGTGNDTVDGGAGQDYMAGGADADTVSYAGRTDDLILRPTGYWESGGRVGWTSWENDCIYHDIENIASGSGNDILFSNQNRPGNNVFGGAGADRIYGSRLHDWLFGDAGDDTLIGGAGTDIMVGGAGSDTFYALGDGAGDSIVGGGEGATAADYDVAQIDRGPMVWDYAEDIDAFL